MDHRFDRKPRAREILFGRTGVAEEELHDLHRAQRRPNRDGAGLGIHAHQVAHEQLAFAVFHRVAHLDADEERVTQQLLIARRQGGEQLAKHFQRRLSIDFEQHVALAPCGDHRLADGPAPLRHDGLDREVAGEGHAHGAAAPRPRPKE